MIGTTISHYRILEKLGEGGMGVVYKARDIDLDRPVALKFLPEHSSVSEADRERFLQEARSAAALNHPNICTIYGIEKDGGRQFIAMEHIDGGTLRTRIPFAKVDDAIGMAIQIGDGIQEAHANGIVHRDIKADNIMVTSKGQVKVMDFGLAKLKGSFKLTRTSGTVGTLAYMAPEQIQGGEVDSQCDIFSFGVLLFEMLTGHLPFRGEHEAAMIYSIVNEEPRSISELRPDVPPLIANLIQRCLEKDPADRFQHMDDVTSELRRTQKKISGKVMRSSADLNLERVAGQSRPEVPRTAEPPVPSSKRRRKPLGYVMAGLAAVVTVFGVWRLLSTSGPGLNPDLSTRVLQLPYPEVSYSSISADGNWIAFPAADADGTWDIYYSHVSGREPKRITNDREQFFQQSADISPDGSQVAYIKPNRQTMKLDCFVVSSLGGQSRKIAEKGILPRWRPDGGKIGFIRTAGMPFLGTESGYMEFWTVNPDGNNEQREFIDSLHVLREGRFSYCWSPDGGSVGWIRSLSPQSQVLVIHDLTTGAERQLTSGGENLDDLCWTSRGDIIFSSNRGGNTNLWMIPASGGNAVQITKGSGPDIGMSASADGRKLLYLQQQRVGNLWLAKMDGTEIRQLTFDQADTYDAVLSPDGKQIAFVMNDPDPLKNASTLFIIDRNGANRREIVSAHSQLAVPTWSPDGTWLAYSETIREAPEKGTASSPGDTTVSLVMKIVDAENPGPPRMIGRGRPALWVDPRFILSMDVSPGGIRASAGSVAGEAVGLRMYLSPVDGSPPKQLFADSTMAFTEGSTIVYYDVRSRSKGWWVGTMPSGDLWAMMTGSSPSVVTSLVGSPRKLNLSVDPYTTWMRGGKGFLLYSREKNDIRKFDFNRNREERVQSAFPGIETSQFNPGRDGKELVYKVTRIAGKLVLIEDLYR